MKVIIVFSLAVIFDNAWSMPSLQNGHLINKPLSSLPHAACEPMVGTGNILLANEANAANPVLTNDLISNAVITSANFVPLANMPSNFPMTPMISEIVPSLQYGDVTMTGDLPIAGTIKVCGCFPVYGMVTVDGNVPSAGTAVVADSFGNISEVVAKCANQMLL